MELLLKLTLLSRYNVLVKLMIGLMKFGIAGWLPWTGEDNKATLGKHALRLGF